MRATVMHEARDVRIEDVPDPRIEAPTDAVMRVSLACICGSDLWPYGARQRRSQTSTAASTALMVGEPHPAAVSRET
jgi:threonine dehydrogenase-like Zn-dependent dehydrogenase